MFPALRMRSGYRCKSLPQTQQQKEQRERDQFVVVGRPRNNRGIIATCTNYFFGCTNNDVAPQSKAHGLYSDKDVADEAVLQNKDKVIKRNGSFHRYLNFVVPLRTKLTNGTFTTTKNTTSNSSVGKITWIFALTSSVVLLYKYHEFLCLAYSALVCYGKFPSLYNDTLLLQDWDLRNIISQNNAFRDETESYHHQKLIQNTMTTNNNNTKNFIKNNSTTLLELQQNLSTYLPPRNPDQLNALQNHRKYVPFLVNPFLSLPFFPWSQYCSFKSPPRRDMLNVIDISNDFVNHLNPWHCVNEQPLGIWCLLAALDKYNREDTKYEYDLIFPEGTDENTWCAQLARVVVGSPLASSSSSSEDHHFAQSKHDKKTLQQSQTHPVQLLTASDQEIHQSNHFDHSNQTAKSLSRHYLMLQKQWLNKIQMTSNFLSFDVNQKPIPEYKMLRRAVLNHYDKFDTRSKRNYNNQFDGENNKQNGLTDGNDQEDDADKDMFNEIDDNYAVFVQRERERSRKVVDSQTFKFETVLTSILKQHHTNDTGNINEDMNKPIPKLKVVYLENLPLTTQIRLLSKAKLLIAVHGAGLMNMLWLPPHAGVIEITLRKTWNKPWYVRGDFFNLAKYLGLQYRFYDPEDSYFWNRGVGKNVEAVYLDSREFGGLVREFWDYLLRKESNGDIS